MQEVSFDVAWGKISEAAVDIRPAVMLDSLFVHLILLIITHKTFSKLNIENQQGILKQKGQVYYFLFFNLVMLFKFSALMLILYIQLFLWSGEFDFFEML